MDMYLKMFSSNVHCDRDIDHWSMMVGYPIFRQAHLCVAWEHCPENMRNMTTIVK